MKLERYDTTDVSTEWAMFKSDTGEWVEYEVAAKLKELVAELKEENEALFENNKELYAAGLAMKVENKRLKAALDAVLDATISFANAHSLPCLEDATIIALKSQEAKG